MLLRECAPSPSCRELSALHVSALLQPLADRAKNGCADVPPTVRRYNEIVEVATIVQDMLGFVVSRACPSPRLHL